MSYRPRNGELVQTLIPDCPGAQPIIALAIKAASKEEKHNWIVEFKQKLSLGEEIEEESLEDWLSSDSIWICLHADEISMVHEDNIVGPLTDD